MRKYMIYNHNTNQNERYDSLQEAEEKLRDFIIEHILIMSNRAPITVVDIDGETQIETWRNIDNEIVPNQEQQEKILQKLQSKYDWV